MGWPQSVALQDAAAAGQARRAQPRAHRAAVGAGARRRAVGAAEVTTLGFEIRAVGANARAAAFAGMPVGWVTVKVALLSGALAGLAGRSRWRAAPAT